MLDRLRKLLSPHTSGSQPDRRDRSPLLIEAEEQGESTLRERLERGDTEAWPLLAALLHDQGQETEAIAVRESLATSAPRDQLSRLVDLAMQRFDPAAGACFQSALVSRFPADARALERAAALLAESGAYDEAMTRFREALAMGNPWPYFLKYPMYTIRALTAGERWDDAEELLRAYPDELYATSALALLLQARDRTAEAETLLRDHPQATHPVLRLTLCTLLERAARDDEAAAVRPPEGWPHERFAPLPRPPRTTPDAAIWDVVDVWGQATAV
ncbi:hypothetical protein [Actinoplanes couchii]|uniref:Tetratricopeptide repeat protein n=1 Tax=Actinoplanes couchii TaxID=403638 RepID=A0ABQ3XQ80_9ACTN|nr:hypothetical protein [Actinoplanes couchii]MDR6322996.1 tetratricopeptide (TPR) repeat protein [Actinoplanes couchii]GID60670.1 hypothetical protein Aco03nite_090740 [Actinoplanes couchii]